MTDLVRHHHIVDPDVLRPNINTIQTTMGSAPDSHVVDLTIRAGVDREMEGRRVYQRYIMNGKVANIVQSEQAGTTDRTSLVELVAMALNRTLGRGREELKVGGVLDEDHVASGSASPCDSTIKLQGPRFTVLQSYPVFKVVVSGGNDNYAAILTGGKRGVDGRGDVAAGFATIFGDVAGLDGSLGRD